MNVEALAYILVGLICTAVAIWFLVRQRDDESSAVTKKPMPASTDIAVPDVFDGQRILGDLVKLADTPGAVDKYVFRLKKKFVTAGQIDLLNQWEQLYKSARSTIEAKTELRRAESSYTQLETEDEIKRRKKEVELAKLDADEAEERLRKIKAEKEQEDMAGPTGKKSPYEKAMDDAWTREKNELTWEIRNHAKLIAKLEALSLWYNDELANIHKNKRLTPEQQTELVQELQKIYEEEKGRIKNNQPSSSEDSAGPAESIFTQ